MKWHKLCSDSKRCWVFPSSLLKLQWKCSVFRFFGKSGHLRPKRWFSEASSDLETQGSQSKILIMLTLARKGPGAQRTSKISSAHLLFFNPTTSIFSWPKSNHSATGLLKGSPVGRETPRTPQLDGLTPCRKTAHRGPWRSVRRPCSLTPVVEVVLCQEHGLQCQVGTPCYVASCQL